MKNRIVVPLLPVGSALVLATFLLTEPSLQAQTVTWNVPGGGNWDFTTDNWSPGPPGLFENGDAAIFNNTNGGTITIVDDVAPLSTTVSATEGTYTLTGAAITSGSLTKSNGGTLVLATANSYAGDTTVNAGTLVVGHDSAVGTGTLSLRGAFHALDASARTISNEIALGANTVFGTDTTGNLLFTGNVDAGGLGKTFTVDNALTEFSGDITKTGDSNLGKNGAGTLVLSGSLLSGIGNMGVGAGTLVLSGVNDHVTTSVAAGGTLRVTNTQGFGTGVVTANTGTLQLLNDGAGSGGTIGYDAGGFLTNSGEAITIHVGNNGANTGNTVSISSPSDTYSFGNATLNVTGANEYSLEIQALELQAGNSGTATLNPTTANLTLGSVTRTSSGHTLRLDGTSSGNRITGVISNGGFGLNIIKSGTSIWSVEAANTYTGNTTIDGGILAYSGSHAGNGAFTVNDGGTLLFNGSKTGNGTVIVADGGLLGGTGQIAGDTTVEAGGVLSPGTSPGTITFHDDLALESDSIVAFEPGDLIVVDGQLSLPDTWTLDLAGSTDWAYDATGWTVLFDYSTADLTAGWDAWDNILFPSLPFDTSLVSLENDMESGEIRLMGAVAVPEPSTFVLLACGSILAGLVATRNSRLRSVAVASRS